MEKLLIDHEFISELKKQIQGAQKRIYAVIFLVYIHKHRTQDDAREIRDLLIDAKKRGLDVRIIINRNLKRNLFTSQNKDFADVMSSAGITIVVTDTRRTTHCKIWVIDDEKVIIGSHNLTGASLHSNREISIITENREINEQLATYIEKQIFETITR